MDPMLPPTNTLRIAACLLGDTVAWPVRRLTRAFSQLFRGRREHSRGGAMGVSIMRVEARDGRYHIALAACVLGILTLLMLVIGVAGPQQTGYQVNSAYNCTSDDDNHRGPCVGGVALGEGQTFETSVNGLVNLNQYLALQVYPFLRRDRPVAALNATLSMEVSLFARHPLAGPSDGVWWLLKREVHRHDLVCFFDSLGCLPYYILDEPDLVYSDYKVATRLLGVAPNGSSPLGDFWFQWEGANPAYAQEEMGFRIAFAIVALALAIVFSVRMWRVPYRLWTMEQAWTLALAYTLAVSNNALYPLQVLTASVFWPLLFSLFEGAFIALWFLYCLVYVDMVRLQQPRVFWDTPATWIKVALVSVHFFLSIALFMWEQVLLANDPIVAPSQLTGITVLFYFVAIGFVALLAWLAVLISFITPLLVGQMRYYVKDPLSHLRSRRRRQQQQAPQQQQTDNSNSSGSSESNGSVASAARDDVQSASESEQGEGSAVDWHDVVNEGSSSSAVATVAATVTDDGGFVVAEAAQMRYLHTVLPMCLVLLSTLIALFFGSFGPFARTAAGFMYFHMLYNCVIVFWMFGYWPLGDAARASLPVDDRTALVSRNPFAVPQSDDDAL